MKSWKSFGMVSCVVALSGCASDLTNSDFVSPPFQDHANLKAAELARARGDIPQAIHDYRDIIKVCIDCEKAYISLGTALLDGNAVEESKQTFEKAITLYPKSAGAYTGLGTVYLTIDQPENAMRAFDTALKLDPCRVKAINGYGIALDMIGDHFGAQAHYRAAMERNPGNLSYESNLGLSLALAGNTAEAIRVLEKLSRCPQLRAGAPLAARVRQNLSLAYGLAGDMKMARTIGTVDLPNDWVRNNISYMEAVRETEEYAGLIPKNHMTGPLNETREWQSKNK